MHREVEAAALETAAAVVAVEEVVVEVAAAAAVEGVREEVLAVEVAEVDEAAPGVPEVERKLSLNHTDMKEFSSRGARRITF